MGIQSLPPPVDAAAANYQLKFPVDPKVMDALQRNAQRLEGRKFTGPTPPELQDILEQVTGDINKFDLAFVSNDNRSLILKIDADAPLLPPPAGTGGLPDGIGGRANPFLTATFILILVEVMTEMMKAQSEQKLIEKELDLMAQQWQFELAVRAADEIMSAAKTEALMHYLLAASAAVQIGVAVGQGAVGGAMMARSIQKQNRNEGQAKTYMQEKRIEANRIEREGPKAADNDKQAIKNQAIHEKDKKRANQRADKAQEEYQTARSHRWANIASSHQMMMFPMMTVKDVADNTAKMYENLVQGILKVEKARHEAALKIIEGYQDVARRIATSASEAWKELQENINAEADFMTKIIDKNYQAFTYRIH